MTAVLDCNAVGHLVALLEEERPGYEAFQALARHAPVPAIRSIHEDPATGLRQVLEARRDSESPRHLEHTVADRILADIASVDDYLHWPWDDAPDLPVFGLPGSKWDVRALREDPAIAKILFVGTTNASFFWFGEIGHMPLRRARERKYLALAKKHCLVTVYR